MALFCLSFTADYWMAPGLRNRKQLKKDLGGVLDMLEDLDK